MGMNLSYPVICIVGPTASGKSELAQRIALALGGEVVSADSMQVYRGMDIGTGKVPARERLVAHHGLDLVSPIVRARVLRGHRCQGQALRALRRDGLLRAGGRGRLRVSRRRTGGKRGARHLQRDSAR